MANVDEQYQLLEHEFAQWCGMEHTVSCNSGTAALHLALEALELPAGSQVIVPEFTFIACARAVTMAGLVPVFVDCGDDLLVDPCQIEDCCNSRTKAIMPVHIYGRYCDMDMVYSAACTHDLQVIEDRAECPRGYHHYKPDAACWSFYRNKVIAGEEGGMVAFKDEPHAVRARKLKSQGYTGINWLHSAKAHNYRMTNGQASMVRDSLTKFEQHTQHRAKVENWLNQLIPIEWQMPLRSLCWMYDLRIPGKDNEDIVKKLNERGIEARPGFKPMSMQPEYLGHYRHLNAYKMSREILYLPVRNDTTYEECKIMAKTLKMVVG